MFLNRFFCGDSLYKFSISPDDFNKEGFCSMVCSEIDLNKTYSVLVILNDVIEGEPGSITIECAGFYLESFDDYESLDEYFSYEYDFIQSYLEEYDIETIDIVVVENRWYYR